MEKYIKDFLEKYPNCKQPDVCSQSLSQKCICPQISLKELVVLDFRFKDAPYKIKNTISELSPLSNWRFTNKEEANLAASMWLVIPKDQRDVNQFKYQYKFVLKILGITETFWYM